MRRLLFAVLLASLPLTAHAQTKVFIGVGTTSRGNWTEAPPDDAWHSRRRGQPDPALHNVVR